MAEQGQAVTLVAVILVVVGAVAARALATGSQRLVLRLLASPEAIDLGAAVRREIERITGADARVVMAQVGLLALRVRVEGLGLPMQVWGKLPAL
jgi:hypothetical protein